jgi:hypothetical protein
VAIAYDTSLSLSAFAPIIARAQHAFAEGVSRKREFINFMNFSTPYLLKEWSDDPWVLQGAIVGALVERS